MKEIKGLIKLTNLNSEKVNDKELKYVSGGFCGCGCYYSNCGGSSDVDNAAANAGSNPPIISSFPPASIKEWNFSIY